MATLILLGSRAVEAKKEGFGTVFSILVRFFFYLDFFFPCTHESLVGLQGFARMLGTLFLFFSLYTA